ncbi:MAG TPA: hypothetical protein VMH83_08105 [Candidatus Acidoferrum sp.]|nr:hypothetical protein [Candidatus Acidoferrum sp.]
MKAKILAISGLVLATTSFAEDGLVVHFTIKKTVEGKVNTYSNGVLLRLTEASTITSPQGYEMRLESKAVDGDAVNLVVTLKDLSSNKPIYAGSGAVKLKVATSATVPLHQLEQAQSAYEVFLDTSYGQLPTPAH